MHVFPLRVLHHQFIFPPFSIFLFIKIQRSDEGEPEKEEEGNNYDFEVEGDEESLKKEVTVAEAWCTQIISGFYFGLSYTSGIKR